MSNNSINGLTEDEIRGLADEALVCEGVDTYFPGLDPDTVGQHGGYLADYLIDHPEDWAWWAEEASWEFIGDVADVVAFAVERGAKRAPTISTNDVE